MAKNDGPAIRQRRRFVWTVNNGVQVNYRDYSSSSLGECEWVGGWCWRLDRRIKTFHRDGQFSCSTAAASVAVDSLGLTLGIPERVLSFITNITTINLLPPNTEGEAEDEQMDGN